MPMLVPTKRLMWQWKTSYKYEHQNMVITIRMRRFQEYQDYMAIDFLRDGMEYDLPPNMKVMVPEGAPMRLNDGDRVLWFPFKEGFQVTCCGIPIVSGAKGMSMSNGITHHDAVIPATERPALRGTLPELW